MVEMSRTLHGYILPWARLRRDITSTSVPNCGHFNDLLAYPPAWTCSHPQAILTAWIPLSPQPCENKDKSNFPSSYVWNLSITDSWVLFSDSLKNNNISRESIVAQRYCELAVSKFMNGQSSHCIMPPTYHPCSCNNIMSVLSWQNKMHL